MLVLANGDEGGGQLRQRGADGDDGETNHQIADAKALGYGHRPPHQQARGTDQQHQPDHQPEQGQLEGHAFAVDALLGLRIQRIPLAAHAGPDGPAHQRQEHHAEDDGVRAIQATIQQQGAGEQGDAEQDGDLLAHHLGGYGDGADQGRQAENKGDIGNVGAIGIAEREPGIALGGRQRGDHHFRGRGTKTDDHHADQQRRHTGITGSGGGTVHELVGTPDQQRQSGNQGNKSQGHIFLSHPRQTREPGNLPGSIQTRQQCNGPPCYFKMKSNGD